MEAFPVLSVDVAFATDPLDTPTWTNVAEATHTLNVVTGRQQELDTNQPGVATVELDNSERRFDPLYEDGPHYGDLLPNKRLRVQATYGGTTYDVFTGFVDGWPQEYMPPGESVCRVTATDAFKLLSRRRITQRSYDEAVLAELDLVGYWTFDEPAGLEAIDVSGNENHGVYRSTVGQSDPVVPYQVGKSRLVPIKWEAAKAPRGPISGQSFSLECWLQIDVPHPIDPTANEYASGIVLWSQGSTRTSSFSLDAVGAGDLTWWLLVLSYPDYAEISSVLSTGSLSVTPYLTILHRTFVELDQEPHHFAVTKSGANHAAYYDGSPFPLEFDLTGSVPADVVPREAKMVWRHPEIGPGLVARVDSLAVYNDVLTAGDIADHYNAGVDPWDGDTTGERVDRILDLIGWPTALADIDTGITILGPDQTTDEPVLDHFARIETTEQGALYVDHRDGGKLRFRDRHKTLTETRHTVSQATFSDDPAETLHYDDLDLVYDETLILNRFTINWNGGTVVVDDTASQAVYGVLERSVDTMIDRATEAQSLGDWLLLHYKDVFLRVSGMTLVPSATNGAARDALFAQCLGRRIGDRVTIERTPQNLGDPISIDVLIEGIAHNVADGVNRWETTFWFSPAEIGSYWVLGTSELGVDTVLAY